MQVITQTPEELLQEIKDFRTKAKGTSVSTTHIFMQNEWLKIANKIMDIYSEVRIVKKTTDEISRAYRIVGYQGKYIELIISV